jgi:peptidoglycan hydrolase-like protein with peptidoglycan-binding domain
LLAGCGETTSDRASGGAAERGPVSPASAPMSTSSAAQPAPARVAMAGDDVRQAQKALRAQGFYHGAIDGLYGPQTRSAVDRYQRKNGLRDTAQLDADTMARLNGGTATTYGDIGVPDRNAGARQ